LELVLHSTRILILTANFINRLLDSPFHGLSSIVSDIDMQDLEMKALQRLSISSSFYVRYVNDIALAYDASHIDTLMNTFNSFHSRLKFITEIDRDKLDFLNVSLIKKENSLIQNWW